MAREQKEAKSGAVGTLPVEVASGRRRVKSKVSAYSPMASRIERQGKAPETITQLERAAVVERALGEFGQLTLSLGGGR